MPSTIEKNIFCLLKCRRVLTEEYILKTQCWRVDAAEGCKWKTKGFYQKTQINKQTSKVYLKIEFGRRVFQKEKS